MRLSFFWHGGRGGGGEGWKHNYHKDAFKEICTTLIDSVLSIKKIITFYIFIHLCT